MKVLDHILLVALVVMATLPLVVITLPLGELADALVLVWLASVVVCFGCLFVATFQKD